jgi:hypothetical protein
MTLNTWTPENASAKISADDIEKTLLEYIHIGAQQNLEQAIAELSPQQIQALTPLMKQDIAFWHTAADKLGTAEVIHLIHFFTLAEEKNSQLFAGKQSPVIALNKLLKKRNTPLSKEELLWIKSHSSNRFLPNGSVL